MLVRTVWETLGKPGIMAGPTLITSCRIYLGRRGGLYDWLNSSCLTGTTAVRVEWLGDSRE